MSEIPPKRLNRSDGVAGLDSRLPFGGDSSSHNTAAIGTDTLLFDPRLSRLFALFLKLPIFRLALAWQPHPPRTVFRPCTQAADLDSLYAHSQTFWSTYNIILQPVDYHLPQRQHLEMAGLSPPGSGSNKIKGYCRAEDVFAALEDYVNPQFLQCVLAAALVQDVGP
jgi:hypothetical protein